MIPTTAFFSVIVLIPTIALGLTFEDSSVRIALAVFVAALQGVAVMYVFSLNGPAPLSDEQRAQAIDDGAAGGSRGEATVRSLLNRIDND